MGAVTIDSLEIRLQTTGSKGKSAIKGLSDSMNKLGKASGGATLSLANFAAKITASVVSVKR